MCKGDVKPLRIHQCTLTMDPGKSMFLSSFLRVSALCPMPMAIETSLDFDRTKTQFIIHHTTRTNCQETCTPSNKHTQNAAHRSFWFVPPCSPMSWRTGARMFLRSTTHKGQSKQMGQVEEDLSHWDKHLWVYSMRHQIWLNIYENKSPCFIHDEYHMVVLLIQLEWTVDCLPVSHWCKSGDGRWTVWEVG